MKKIDGSPKNLKQLLQNTKYSIHYYQREYMWQRKHIEELIDDLTSEFLEYYDPSHQRMHVAIMLDCMNPFTSESAKNSTITLTPYFINFAGLCDSGNHTR